MRKNFEMKTALTLRFYKMSKKYELYYFQQFYYEITVRVLEYDYWIFLYL